MNDYTNDQIASLARMVEPSVIASLVAHGFAEIDFDNELSFDNLILTDETASKLGITNKQKFYEDKQFLKNLLETFPEGNRCSSNALQSRLKVAYKKFLHNYTAEDVIEAAIYWCRSKQYPYQGDLINFIYKYDRSRVFDSRLHNTIIELKKEEQRRSSVSVSSSSESIFLDGVIYEV